MNPLTQQQLLLILRQFHLVSYECGGEPYHDEREVVQLLYAQLDESSKKEFAEDCSELVSWL